MKLTTEVGYIEERLLNVIDDCNVDICKSCNILFNNFHDYAKHILHLHKHDLLIYASKEDTNKLLQHWFQNSKCCPKCELMINDDKHLFMHYQNCANFQCSSCTKQFQSRKSIRAHMNVCKQRIKTKPKFHCRKCDRICNSSIQLQAHSISHDMKSTHIHNDYGQIFLREASLLKRCGAYEITSKENELCIRRFIEKTHELIKRVIECDLDTNLRWKAQLQANVQMYILNHDGTIKKRRTFGFMNRLFILHTLSFNTWLMETIADIENRIDRMTNLSSGWIIEKIINVEFRFIQYVSPDGSGMFPLDCKLTNKKAVINIDTNKNDCFKLSVLCGIHYKDIKHHPNRSSVYTQWMNDLNMDGIKEPVEIDDIKKFEKQNPDIKITVHFWENDKAKPIYDNVTIPRDRKHHINLLYVQDSKSGRSHYCYIRNLNRLLNTKEKTRNIYCYRCHRKFHQRSKHLLDEHLEFCKHNQLQIEEMPKLGDSKLKFKNHSTTLKPPFVLYADIECYIDTKSSQHIPAAISCLLIPNNELQFDSVPKLNNSLIPSFEIKTFSGDNCIHEFLVYVDTLSDKIYNLDQSTTLFRQKMAMTSDEEEQSTHITNCQYCGVNFDETNSKVMDHNHYTGKFNCVSCSKCNFQFARKRRYLPIFFHNLRGYDMHFLCKYGFGEMKIGITMLLRIVKKST